MVQHLGSIFVSHGHFEFSRAKNILIYKIIGAWNLQMAEEFNKHLLKEISELENPGKWCRIMDMSEYQLCTFDAIEELMKVIDIEESRGCILRCYCNITSTHKQLVEKKYKSNPPVYFNSVNEAKLYSLEQLEKIKT
ncbi:hypothetical protein [Pseudoalteromonas rhizosphaerae]|uniref:hypothetical protein n=1 Tax=Pseudoalteromonas rhizosphaerae TaxID=2518973 RepID=UPI00123117A2|nr:hypothetical protein [Pseudoalteromonas rhizosphaerae]